MHRFPCPNAPVLLALAALTAGCTPEFSPSTEIDRLHLLAIQAEPPEIAAAPDSGQAAVVPDRARLTALVAHPADVSADPRPATVVYFACTPRPGSPSVEECGSYDGLEKPASLGAAAAGASCSAGTGGGTAGAPGQGVIGGLSFSGVETCDASGCKPVSVRLDPNDPATAVTLPAPSYVLPPEFRLEQLPPGSPARLAGQQVLVIAVAVDARPEELLPGATASADPCAVFTAIAANFQRLVEERDDITATKRIIVRGPDSVDEPNRNPALPGLLASGALIAADGSTPPFAAGAPVEVRPQLPVDSSGAPLPAEAFLQRYCRYDTEGALVEEQSETWAFSWFSTAGELSKSHTKELEAAVRWTPPSAGDVFPAGGRVRLYAVVRDMRGGTAWVVRDVAVALP